MGSSLTIYSIKENSFTFKVYLSSAFNTEYYKRIRITKTYYGRSTSSVDSYLKSVYAKSREYTKKYYKGNLTSDELIEGETYTLYAYAQARNGIWYKAGSKTITMLESGKPEDLRIEHIILQDDLFSGKDACFKIMVKNHGDKTSGEFDIGIYDEDKNKLALDIEPSLAGGESYNSYLHVTMDEPGSHRLKFKISGNSSDTEYKTYIWKFQSFQTFKVGDIIPNGFPMAGYHITQGFNDERTNAKGHLGYDMKGGTYAKSIFPGTVYAVRKVTGNDPHEHYGSTVVLKHNINGVVFYSNYQHLETITVKEGQKIESTDYKLGKIGDSGSPGAVHLHLAIYVDSGNPRVYGYCSKKHNTTFEDTATRDGYEGDYLNYFYGSTEPNHEENYPRCGQKRFFDPYGVISTNAKLIDTYRDTLL